MLLYRAQLIIIIRISLFAYSAEVANMGRKRAPAEKEAFQKTIVKYKTQILSNNKICSKRSDIWTRISNDLDGAFSPGACFTAVSKNYYEAFRLLDIEPENRNYGEGSSSYSDDSISPVISDDEGAIRFEMKVTYEAFLHLRPQSRIYSDIGQNRNYSTRIYVFGQKLWTHFFYEIIRSSLKQYGCDCVFMFKRAKIHPNSDNLYAYSTGS